MECLGRSSAGSTSASRTRRRWRRPLPKRGSGLRRLAQPPPSLGPEWAYPNVDTFDCIEVWNGPWPLMNEIALEFWESRLRAGSVIPPSAAATIISSTAITARTWACPRSGFYCAERTLGGQTARGAAGRPRHDLRQPTRRASRSAPSGADGRRCNAPRKITPHVSVEVSRGKRLHARTAHGGRLCQRQPIREDDCRSKWRSRSILTCPRQLSGRITRTRAVSNPIYCALSRLSVSGQVPAGTILKLSRKTFSGSYAQLSAAAKALQRPGGEGHRLSRTGRRSVSKLRYRPSKCGCISSHNASRRADPPRRPSRRNWLIGSCWAVAFRVNICHRRRRPSVLEEVGRAAAGSVGLPPPRIPA